LSLLFGHRFTGNSLGGTLSLAQTKMIMQKILDQHYASYTKNILKNHLLFFENMQQGFFFPHV